MAAKKSKGTKKQAQKVERKRMKPEEKITFFKKYCKEHDIKAGTEQHNFAMEYAGGRLAALARNAKKAA